MSTRDRTAFTGRLLLGAAAGIALYLASMALARTSLPGCGTESVCQEVLQSRWAYTFGIPVSFAGFVLYAMTLLLSWAYVRRERTLAALAGGMAVSTVLAGVVWFTAVQIFALQSLCAWCCATHGTAVTGAFLLWWSRRRHPAPDLDCSVDLRDAGSPLSNDRVFRFTATGAALAAVGLLALGNLSGSMPRASAREESLNTPAVAPAGGGTLGLMGGRYQVQPADYPVMGNPGGSGPVAVLLSDFTCEWCLKFHSVVEHALRSGAPEVRVLVMPVARTPEATDIQRTLLTVFHADPAAWHALAARLVAGDLPDRPEAVGRAALHAIGGEKFAASAQANRSKIEAQLKLAAALLNDARDRGTGSTLLPQLYCDTRVLKGAESEQAKVIAFLHNHAAGEGPSPAAPGAVMTVLNADVDLDSLPPGAAKTFQIKVQNRGDAPLQIGWLMLDQGCEVTQMPDKKLLPGKVAAIGLKCHAPSGAGDFVRRILIHSDAPDAPHPVVIRGHSEGPATAAIARP
jgi:uncharacterized membrane protein